MADIKQYFWPDKAINEVIKYNLTKINNFLNIYQKEIRKIGFVTAWDVLKIDGKYGYHEPFWRATFKIKGVERIYTFNLDLIDTIKINDAIILKEFDRNRLPELAEKIRDLEAKFKRIQKRVSKLVGQRFKTASTKRLVTGTIESGTATQTDEHEGDYVAMPENFYDFNFIIKFGDGTTREYTDIHTVEQGIWDYQTWRTQD